MAENVMVKMNITSGEVQIEAPAESLDTIFSKLETFLPSMARAHGGYLKQKIVEDDDPAGGEESLANDTDRDDDIHDIEQKAKTRKKRTAASKKPESFKPVDLGLTEKQRGEFREFYGEKNPGSQNDQVLVIMYWLKAVGKKEALSKEEIYTGFRTVDAKVPARISSVLSNLGIEGRIISDSDGYHIHHTGEDHVKFDLPKKEGKK